MGRKVFLLVAATSLATALSASVAEGLAGPGHWRPAILAGVLCLLPAVVTLVTAVFFARHAPDYWSAVVLSGTVVRMVAAVGSVMVLGGAVAAAGIPPVRLAGWVAFLYIVTLAVETAILARPVGRPCRRAGTTTAASP